MISSGIKRLRLLGACLLFLLTAGLVKADRLEINGTIFYTFRTSASELDLFWLDASGKRFGQFSTLQKALEARSRKIRFIMNAGIFEPEGIPSGLLVIDGKTYHPINVSKGRGNFYLKPNGVFYIDQTGGHIFSTEEYLHRMPTPRIAIQSGPLLLNHGAIHSAFRKESTSYLHRNGVGICADGSIVFAITEFGQARYPNLYEFAELFRKLGCSDALFLDGDLSQMIVDPKGQITPGNYFGAIFAVAPKVDGHH